MRASTGLGRSISGQSDSYDGWAATTTVHQTAAANPNLLFGNKTLILTYHTSLPVALGLLVVVSMASLCCSLQTNNVYARLTDAKPPGVTVTVAVYGLLTDTGLRLWFYGC